MNISGKTKVTGLFGWPVEHSFSPAMHNAAFEHLKLDYCYVTFPVRPDMLGDAVKGVRALTLGGINVTVPHKENVIQFLDEVSEEATFIGAVNTVRNDNGRLTGYNTDGRGFMQSLSEAGIDISGRKVIIVGAGGASRAIGYYICKQASELYLYDVDLKKADTLIQHLKSQAVGCQVLTAESQQIRSAEFFSTLDVVINATPLGLKPEDPLPVDISLLKSSHTVCDLIYKETPLLREASGTGCKTLNGLGMLLWQGVFAFEIWTGKRPPVEIMKNALLNAGEKE